MQFVGVDTRELQRSAPRVFVRTHHLDYPNFFDTDGDLMLKVPARYLDPMGGIPFTLVLDRRGRIAARAWTPLTADQLTALVAPLAAERLGWRARRSWRIPECGRACGDRGRQLDGRGRRTPPRRSCARTLPTRPGSTTPGSAARTTSPPTARSPTTWPG
ncbi:TlpA family protein disulfide reductase [Streptacidiphilus monticola]